MSKNKVILGLMAVAVITGTLLVFSRIQQTPITVEGQIEPKVDVASPTQEQQVAKPTGKQQTENIVIQVPQTSEQNLLSPTQHAEFDGLVGQMGDYYSNKIDNMLENPVHPGRAKLHKQMRKETFGQTFDNLVNNGNFAMLMPVMGGSPFSPGVYESDIVIVSRMTRVRKLLEDARKNPAEVAAFLQKQITELVKDYPQQYTEFLQNLDAAGPEGLRSKELSDHHKTRLLCTSAVYVLSQIGDTDSLETLAWLSEQGEAGKKNSWPVNPKFLFYAMHNIVQKSPGASLSGNSYEYLEKTSALDIPDAKKIKVPSWNAFYHEGDFRRMLPGSRIDLSLQPTIELEIFPQLEHLNAKTAESLLTDLRQLVG